MGANADHNLIQAHNRQRPSHYHQHILRQSGYLTTLQPKACHWPTSLPPPTSLRQRTSTGRTSTALITQRPATQKTAPRPPNYFKMARSPTCTWRYTSEAAQWPVRYVQNAFVPSFHDDQIYLISYDGIGRLRSLSTIRFLRGSVALPSSRTSSRANILLTSGMRQSQLPIGTTVYTARRSSYHARC